MRAIGVGAATGRERNDDLDDLFGVFGRRHGRQDETSDAHQGGRHRGPHMTSGVLAPGSV
jgi:hypothetical protein